MISLIFRCRVPLLPRTAYFEHLLAEALDEEHLLRLIATAAERRDAEEPFDATPG